MLTVEIQLFDQVWHKQLEREERLTGDQTTQQEGILSMSMTELNRPGVAALVPVIHALLMM